MHTPIAFASPISASASSSTPSSIHGSTFSSWVAPLPHRPAPRCVRRKRTAIVRLSAANEIPSDESLAEEEREHQELVKKLDPKELKWSEIPFGSVQEELNAIDEYEREEGLEADSVWPKFLRGAAYEHWGQPQLALAQYSKVPQGTELSNVPQLWERKAYNSFKIGKVAEANAYCDVALSIYGQSVGNQLHFAHWFNENFQDYLPKWNGPNANVQRGVFKYCVGMYKGARECVVSQIALEGVDLEHAILWFLAASVKMAPDGIAPEWDMKMVRRALKAQYDWDPRLRLFVDLFVAHATGVFGDVAEMEERISNEVKHDDGDDIVSKVYIALYHDAFTKDHAERDRALDEVVALGSSRNQNDTENFMFCTAKNRFSATGSSASNTLQ